MATASGLVGDATRALLPPLNKVRETRGLTDDPWAGYEIFDRLMEGPVLNGPAAAGAGVPAEKPPADDMDATNGIEKSVKEDVECIHLDGEESKENDDAPKRILNAWAGDKESRRMEELMETDAVLLKTYQTQHAEYNKYKENEVKIKKMKNSKERDALLAENKEIKTNINNNKERWIKHYRNLLDLLDEPGADTKSFSEKRLGQMAKIASDFHHHVYRTPFTR